MNQPSTPSSHPGHAVPPAPSPAQNVPTITPSYEPEFDRPVQSDRKLAYALLACVVVGGTLLVLGASGAFRSSSPAAATAALTAPPAADLYEEQRKMVREAIETAKEAQALQRERLELMRKQMEMGDSMPDGESKPD